MTIPPSPEELARAHGLPLVRVLIDIDLADPLGQLIAGNPADLSEIPAVPVTSIILPQAIVTILAHQGEEEMVAELLRVRPDMRGWAAHYAEHYLGEGVTELAMQAYTEEQIRELEQRLGRSLGQNPDAVEESE